MNFLKNSLIQSLSQKPVGQNVYISTRGFRISATFLSQSVRHQSNERWKDAKEKFLTMDADEKRTFYKCKGTFLSLDRIRPWPVYYDKNIDRIPKTASEKKYPVNFAINNRVSVGKANLISLELDVIVNSASKDLLGGGGVVDRTVHDAAGKELLEECRSLSGCDVGQAKMTGGYRLPAKYVIHTVGPKGQVPAKLASCYISSLTLMKYNRLRTIAFPCISTGSSGFPPDIAAHVALDTVRKFLHDHPDKPHRVCFCIHLPEDLKVYEDLMQVYFPMS